MSFTEQIPFELALKEVNDYLDKKRMLPRRREALQGAVEALAEAVQFGFVVIGDDGTITHTLIDPIKDTTGASVVLDRLAYKARLDAATVNKKVGELKVLTQTTQVGVIATMLTGEVAGMLSKLEPQDKNICDCICLFFI